MATVSKLTRGAVAGNGWTNPANATADDAVYATCAPAKNATVTGDWDFAAFTDAELPVGSTINSVTIETQFKVSTASSVATYHHQPLNNGVAGTDATDTTEPTADKIVTNAAFSTVPTETDLKTAGRIVARAAGQRGNNNTAVTFSLDYAKVTVDYTAPVTDRRLQASVIEVEAPTAPRRLIASVLEVETPTAPRRLHASSLEAEVGAAPRRMLVSGVEFEVPAAGGSDAWHQHRMPLLGIG